MKFSEKIICCTFCDKCGKMGTANDPVIALECFYSRNRTDFIHIHPSCFAKIAKRLTAKPKA